MGGGRPRERNRANGAFKLAPDVNAVCLVGVTRHVGEALGEEVHVRGSKIVALGIAPWGVVQQRNMLSGVDVRFSPHS